jgi:MFS family permease
MTRLSRLVNFLGLRRSIAGALAMVILVGMGERMAERFLPIYIIALGGGEVLAGMLNGMDNLLSALYSYPGGYLSDRLGIKRALLVFNLLAMAGYAVVILIPAWPAVFVGSVFFLSWTAISLPATMDLVATALPKNKRTMGVSMHSLIRRVPMAVGPVIGGALIVRYGAVPGMRLAFGVALGLAAVSAVLQQGLIGDDCDRQEGEGVCAPQPEKNPLVLFREMSPRLRSLLVSDILIRFCEQIPYAYVVLWAVKRVAFPVTEFQFGLLTAAEMVTAVLVYIPVAYLADRGNKKPYVAVTFVFFTLFPLALMYSQSFWPLLAAFVLRGLKEFGEPTRKALIMDLAPEGRKAAMFGLYYLMRDTIVSLAAFGGAGLWLISPQVNFLTAFGFGVAGTAWFVWRGKE